MALEGTQLDALQQLGVSYSQLIDYSSKQYVATLVQVCALVLLTWDCVTTFDDEVAFFWQAERRSRWSLARILFMMNRHLPIILFSLHVYWRVNRSLDNPLCNIKMLINYGIVPVFLTIGILQMLRVWSLYNRTWRVGFFLLALLVLESLVVALAWNLPSLRGFSLAQLAPESLTGCVYERRKGFLDCTCVVTVQTVLLGMVIFKVRKGWRNVGAMPLLRALVVDGAVYYCVFVFAFSLEIVANLSEELYHPLADTDCVVCMNVIACNHLMLYLREVAGRPTSTEPASYSLSRPTTHTLFKLQASDITCAHDDPSQSISLAKRGVPTRTAQLGGETVYMA